MGRKKKEKKGELPKKKKRRGDRAKNAAEKPFG